MQQRKKIKRKVTFDFFDLRLIFHVWFLSFVQQGPGPDRAPGLTAVLRRGYCRRVVYVVYI